ncbi:MAG: SPFH/Band 7/PHB domain protein [Thermoguttaceae bacterium]|nr:SPFH/Band 7/PHB domain protein [Thermoguttaceae bacterium]
MSTISTFIVLGIVLFLLFVLIISLRIVPQAKVYVVERLGTYAASWETGIHFLIPFIDQVARRVSIKENVVDFPPQPVITKDNVTIRIDTVIFYQVTDAKLYTYGVEDPLTAIDKLTATTLRNIIGEMMLDETLTSRDGINNKITSILDIASDKWGIKVNRVELKNIEPPPGVLEAMEKQMRAERERREAILQAEGRKTSEILIAEGEKQAQILRAEAAKTATILQAEAKKEQQIREAEGQAQAILLVQQAQAEGIRLLNASDPTQQVITLKSLEAFAKAADGQATKLIIPSQIQGIAGLAASLSSIVTSE